MSPSGSKRARLAYFVLIHALLAVVLIKSDFIDRVIARFGGQPDEITRYYHHMVGFHYRTDQNLAPGSTIFIGDSHIQGMAVSAVSDRAVNYGIGNDTTVGVLKRLPQYQSVTSAETVVLAIGFNDLRYRSNDQILKNMNEILAYLDTRTTVVLCAVIAVGQKHHAQYNSRIEQLNRSLQKLSMNFSRVSFLDSFSGSLDPAGYLPEKYHLPDAVHLSPFGYQHWIRNLTDSLNRVNKSS